MAARATPSRSVPSRPSGSTRLSGLQYSIFRSSTPLVNASPLPRFRVQCPCFHLAKRRARLEHESGMSVIICPRCMNLHTRRRELTSSLPISSVHSYTSSIAATPSFTRRSAPLESLVLPEIIAPIGWLAEGAISSMEWIESVYDDVG